MTPEERDVELWCNVFGSSADTWEWYPVAVEFVEGDWDQPGIARVTIDSPEVGFTTKDLTIDDVRDALDKCVGKYVQVGTAAPIHEFMNWDADSADTVLQVALFGETIYS